VTTILKNAAISKVAEQCGVSHSLIYNRHPDIKEMINNLKKKQKKQKIVDQEKNKTEKLLKMNQHLKKKLSEHKGREDKEMVSVLMAHIHELYSMYDSLLEERNAFAQQLWELDNE
jgi:predicted Holliday junction resolvase-like endonuclease